MSTFKSAEEIHKILGGFFQELSENPQIGPKLLSSNLKLKFNYREPEASIYVDFSGDKVQILFDDTEHKPDIEMSMKADTAHKFWQGKVNLVVALTRREITAKGPIPKILRLLPIIKPSYAMYGPYLEKIGFSAEDQQV